MKDRVLAFFKWIWDQINAKKWYTFLLVLSTSYLVYYRFDIYELDTINARNLIFLLWLLLLAFPLFSELEFLGIKVKKEVEKATEDVKESFDDIDFDDLLEADFDNILATKQDEAEDANDEYTLGVLFFYS